MRRSAKTSPPLKKSTKSVAEILLATHLDELGLQYRREWRFYHPRRWRFDFVLGDFVGQYWEPNHIAIEIDGYFKGRHGAGWGSDNDKQNHGTMLGWRILRFSTNDVMRGRAKEFLRSHFSVESKR